MVVQPVSKLQSIASIDFLKLCNELKSNDIMVAILKVGCHAGNLALFEEVTPTKRRRRKRTTKY